jgi:hypothetical protein
MALAPAFLEKIVELGLELPSEPPALIPGFMQFYDPKAGSSSVEEAARVENGKQEASSPEEASTRTVSVATAA